MRCSQRSRAWGGRARGGRGRRLSGCACRGGACCFGLIEDQPSPRVHRGTRGHDGGRGLRTSRRCDGCRNDGCTARRKLHPIARVPRSCLSCRIRVGLSQRDIGHEADEADYRYQSIGLQRCRRTSARNHELLRTISMLSASAAKTLIQKNRGC